MPKKKNGMPATDTTNSTNPSVVVVFEQIKPLELNVGGQLNVSGAELQIVVDKLNELIRKK